MLRLHELYRSARAGGQRALLSYADLSGADLNGRDLSEADLTGALLVGARLERINLTGAILFAGNLSKADLRGANLAGANLTGADLFDADLRAGRITVKGKISGDLHDIEMAAAASTPFHWAEMAEIRRPLRPSAQTNLSGAIMRNARFAQADLRDAVLAGADLEGADFANADVRGANFKGAVLIQVELETAHTVGAIFEDALGDKPAGLLIEDLETPLAVLIARHEAWVASEGREGRQLDLSGFDLRTAPPLAGAQLAALKARAAIFFRRDLSGIGLQAAQLDRADLRSSNLEGADLRGISLKGARLANADLRRCSVPWRLSRTTSLSAGSTRRNCALPICAARICAKPFCARRICPAPICPARASTRRTFRVRSVSARRGCHERHTSAAFFC